MKKQCKDIHDLFESYLNGGLSRKYRSEFTDHLKNCPACRERLEQEKKINEVLRSFPHQACPESVTEAIFQQTVHQKRQRKAGHKREAIPVFIRQYALIGAASVAVVLLLVFHPFRNSDEFKTRNNQKISQEELNTAREQAKWSLVYVAQNLKKGEKEAVEDVIMNKVPSTIKKAIEKAIPLFNGGSS